MEKKVLRGRRVHSHSHHHHHGQCTSEESNDSRCAILKKATIRKARIKTVFPDLIYDSAVHSRLAKAFVMKDHTDDHHGSDA